MNKNVIMGIVVVFLILVATTALYRANSSSNQNTNQTVSQESAAPADSSQSSASTSTQGAVKEFTVTGTNYRYDPNILTVNKGDTVKITFKDSDGHHNLVVDGYNQNTNTINSGDSDTIQFVADKTGEFEYYCSVDSHRQLGMKGTLVVK